MATYDEFYNQITKSQQNSLNKDIEQIYKQKDTQVGIVKENYGQQIADTEESYTDLHRENSVQKLLNVRGIREDMANMGLTDSGLSRSQLTAANLSYANQKGALERDMQKAVYGLAMEMNARITELESNASAAEQEIRSTYNNNAIEKATSMYNNWVSEQAAIEKATTEQRNTSLTKLHEYLKDNSSDPDYAAKLIYDWAYTYNAGYDPNTGAISSEIAALLKQAGLTQNEFNIYTKTGTVYTTAEQYNESKRVYAQRGAVIPIGRTKWDYETDGEQTYKFKLAKSTRHVGKVDENDEVDIYNPDDTLLAKNVRIDQLPEDIREAVTDETDWKEEGKTEFTMTVNLKGLKI